MKSSTVDTIVGRVALVWGMSVICFALYGQAVKTDAAKPPVLTAEQREAIRKYQLDDMRFADSIKQKQLEIIDLQRRQQQNAQMFMNYISGACKDSTDGFVFNSNSDDLICIAKPKQEKAK